MSFLTDNMFVILVTSVLILLFYKVKKQLTYFSERGMTSINFSWKDILYAFDMTIFNNLPNDIYKRYSNSDSQYIGFFSALLKPTIVALDPTLVENILIKDFSHFEDHGFEIDFENNPLAGSLFNMKGDEWRTLRHKLVPTFTSGKLRGMVPTMEECADKLIEEIKKNPKLQKDVEIKELFKSFSISVIASCTFGIDPESVKDPNCQFRKVLTTITKPSLMGRIRFLLTFLYPKILKFLNIKMVSQDVEDFMLSLTKQTMDVRKKSGQKRNDFIQLLLELKEKGSVQLDVKDLEHDEKEAMASIQKNETASTKLEFSDELLMAQVFVFLVAGFDNTAFLSAITQYVLSKHPDIQAKVREEVIQQRDKHGSLDYQALRDMKLLGACVDEALRIHTPGIVVVRECSKPYTFSDGTRLEKGVPVLIPAKALHMDSKYWNNPEKFDPERFLNGESIRPGTYMPFGDGPRICIAQRLALLMAKLMIAKLLLNFELTPSTKNKEPLKLNVLLSADFEGGLWGSFKSLKN